MTDKELIEAMGGCTSVATLLGLKNPNKDGAARVCNWKRRGIPSQIKLEHIRIFKRFEKKASA